MDFYHLERAAGNLQARAVEYKHPLATRKWFCGGALPELVELGIHWLLPESYDTRHAKARVQVQTHPARSGSPLQIDD